jgi:arabinoxylan arabinofuranohydrolase
MRLSRMVHASLLALAFAAAPSSPAQKLITPGYLFNSDPTCRQIGDTLYVFTTQDPFTAVFLRDNTYFKGMSAYHAYSTKDFDHWVDHGSILTGRDVSWNAGGALWDGDAGIPANGKYYAYAPFRINAASESNYGRFEIGVFTADNLAGPYRDVFKGPMRTVDGKPLEGLSPYVVKGDDGAKYLMWGAGDTAVDKRGVYIARLKPSMVELAEPARKIQVPMEDSCGQYEYYESPILLKAHGRWVLTWVSYKGESGPEKGPHCEAKGSLVRYAASDSMFGPFDKAPVHTLIYPMPGGEESDQQGLCSYKGRSLLAYHLPYNDAIPYAPDHHRQVALTELVTQADGTFRPIHPETDRGLGTPGVSLLTLDAFAPRREAAEFHVRTGATGEKGLSGEYQMKLKPGGYLLFRAVDFGTGAAGFHVEVSAENPALRDATLEVRLDGPAGPLVGSVPIGFTGGPTNYRALRARIAPAARGTHDLALVARGTGSDTNGHLFNVTSFGFDRTASVQKQ